MAITLRSSVMGFQSIMSYTHLYLLHALYVVVVSGPDDEHCPLLYIVKRDGSGGMQLLRQRDVTEYVTKAQSDPESVVLTECLADCADVACITVLRRAARNPSEMWLCPYTHESVVPPGLQISMSSMARRKVRRTTRAILPGGACMFCVE